MESPFRTDFETFDDEKQFERLLRLVAVLQTPLSDREPAAARVEDLNLPPREGLPPDKIARRAFQLYLQRGGTHGWDMGDWLQAENELREKQQREKTIRRLALSWGLFKGSSDSASSL